MNLYSTYAFGLLFVGTCIFIVTIAYMTPMDRRVFMGFVLDSWRRAIDEVTYQFGRLKRWWDDRKAAKVAAQQKSYGGS